MQSLFTSFFNGTITPEDEQKLWEFVNASEANAKSFKDADLEWRRRPELTDQLRGEYRQLKLKIDNKKRRRAVRWGVAASLLAAAGLASVFILMNISSFGHTKGVLYYSETMSGQQLPDKTTVSLNKGTVLSYDFSRKERTVRLNGEALFDVTHDPKKPFRVYGGNCKIEVLGTRFSVTDYSTDSNAQVILAEGSLHLDMRGNESLLKPGDKVCFDGFEVLKTRVDISEVDSWKSGAILFDSITLADFIKRLSREYEVRVNLINTKYADSRFRASFQREESIENILQTVCEIFPLKLYRGSEGYVLK